MVAIMTQTSVIGVTGLLLASAAFYGAADFLGGLAARRAHTYHRGRRRTAIRASLRSDCAATPAAFDSHASRLDMGRGSRCHRWHRRGPALSRARDGIDGDRRADNRGVRRNPARRGIDRTWRAPRHRRDRRVSCSHIIAIVLVSRQRVPAGDMSLPDRSARAPQARRSARAWPSVCSFSRSHRRKPMPACGRSLRREVCRSRCSPHSRSRHEVRCACRRGSRQSR